MFAAGFTDPKPIDGSRFLDLKCVSNDDDRALLLGLYKMVTAGEQLQILDPNALQLDEDKYKLVGLVPTAERSTDALLVDVQFARAALKAKFNAKHQPPKEVEPVYTCEPVPVSMSSSKRRRSGLGGPGPRRGLEKPAAIKQAANTAAAATAAATAAGKRKRGDRA